MRLLRPPMRFWTMMAAGAIMFAVVAAIIAHRTVQPDDRIEVVKTCLQSLFAVLFGGVLMTFLNVRRDEDQRELARDAAVRDIVEEMHAVHRKLKMVKRRLRAQMSPAPATIGGARVLPYIVPAPAFERAMDDLLAAQIAAEQVRDAVRARDDLLRRRQIDRVHRALHYAARYAHDVYLTFEDCTVRMVDNHYQIGAECRGLVDFLSRRAWDTDPPAPHAAEMTAAYRALKDETAPLEARYAALDRIETLRRETPGRPRYRIVATECIALAAADLQRAVRRERWRLLSIASGSTAEQQAPPAPQANC